MIGKFLYLLLTLFIVSATPVLAQSTEKSDNITGGVQEIAPEYQVFPKGRLGNTIYKNRKKLISRVDLNLKGILEAPEGHVYYGINESDEAVLGFIGGESIQFTELEGKFYELINQSGQHRLYRVSPDKKIQDLLPRSNTASGLVFNDENKAAFFHITKGELVEMEDGKQRYQYTFRIHIVKNDEVKVVHLPDAVADFRAKLKMSWVDKDTLQYILSNDQMETIVIK